MKPLRLWLAEAGSLGARGIFGRDDGFAYAAAASGAVPFDAADTSVLLLTEGQLAAARALLALDGVAARIVLCPPDLDLAHLAALARDAGATAIVTDRAASIPGGTGLRVLAVPEHAGAGPSAPADPRDTEWVLLTSGTTGIPKMVVHSRAGLTGAIAPSPQAERPVVWGTFYDIRRYGGLQVFLRAVLGGSTLVLSEPGEDTVEHLGRLARHGVTHQTGTPSHWRKVLMTSRAGLIDPDYVRLSGEIADQAVLDGLAAAYPRARIGHAYASTEAGVGFEVDDGLEGFPASFLDRTGPVELKIEDGSLRVRSRRAASRYLGDRRAALVDPDGWVDTDDMVERRRDRCHFVGRRSGVINVGGLKVHPEEVEAVINRHAAVRMSLVKARANPITGAIVVADVMLSHGPSSARDEAAIKAEILARCRSELPHHKVPVLMRFTETLAVTPAGKLARPHG